MTGIYQVSYIEFSIIANILLITLKQNDKAAVCTCFEESNPNK